MAYADHINLKDSQSSVKYSKHTNIFKNHPSRKAFRSLSVINDGDFWLKTD